MAKADIPWQPAQWPDLETWRPALALPRWPVGSRSDQAYTATALDDARRSAYHIRDFDPDRDRYVILSDLHKGDRTRGSDEFQINEALYCQALEHYLGQDFRLVLNGDIEEGWKSRYEDILAAYEHSAFALEREFVRRGPGHYLRIYGNHDMDWADPAQVDRHLRPLLGPVQVHAAVVLGERLMITHGHQGDLDADRLAWISRHFVRHLWKPIQRLLDFSPRRAARNNVLALKREKLLSLWARAHRVLLIAGHTHRPYMPDPLRTEPVAFDPGPYYLNDGCGVHHHSITGIEIDQGELRLVKWEPDCTGQSARYSVFQRTDLRSALARL